jgi:hypothetical protein
MVLVDFKISAYAGLNVQRGLAAMNVLNNEQLACCAC